jgi:predicted nucleotidyltransferase
MATILPPDFKEFLKLLKEHEVRYLLIGGYAVGYHGYARATEDMDIWVAIHPENAQKIFSALKAFGLDDSNLKPELFLQKPKIIRMGFPPMRLEITTSISGVEFDACYQTRIVDKIDGVEVNLIDLESLIRNKAASGRTKDTADVEKLEQIKRKS